MNTKAAELFSKIILSDKPVRIKLLGDSITHGVALNDLLADGLHPNDRGYAVMFHLLMKELGIALPHKDIQLTRA